MDAPTQLLAHTQLLAGATLPFAAGGSISRALIVGREKNGLVLVARDGLDSDGQAKTFIETFDTQKQQHAVLYTHFNTLNIVSASVNVERTLLAFTTVSRAPTDQHEVYESFLVEIQPQAQRYEFNIKSRAFQCIQFVHAETKPRQSLFFFVLDRKRIELYVIATKVKKGPGDTQITEIASLPSLQQPFVKGFMWYHWDPLKLVLYYMTKADKSSKDDSNFVLHRIPLADKAQRPAPIPVQIRIPENHVNWPVMSSWVLSDSEPGRALHITPVQLGEGLCLCVQHPRTGSELSIDMSVYVLHQNLRCSVTIPLHTYDSASIQRMRVVCTRVSDLLALCLPGIYMALIDCGTVDESRRVLVFQGADAIPPLPSSLPAPEISPRPDVPKQLSTFLACPFELPCTESNDNSAMLDCRSAVVYEVALIRRALLSVFTSEVTRDFAAVIHIALVHLSDMSLVSEIMDILFQKMPHHVTGEIVRELLTGLTYHHVRALPLGAMLSSLLPVTCLTANTIRGVSWSVHAQAEKESLRPLSKRFSGGHLTSSPNPAPASPAQSDGWSPLRLLGFMTDKKKEEEAVARAKRPEAYDDPLTRHIQSVFPRESITRCAQWAMEVRAVQKEQCQRVFARMCSNEDVSVRLQLLLCMHNALEELQQVAPDTFQDTLADASVRVLPRSMFQQFVDAGVVRVSDSVIREQLAATPTGDNDVTFEYDMLCHASSKDSYMQLLETLPEAQPYLLEQYLSQLPTPTLPPSHSYDSARVVEEADFIPNALVMTALQTMTKQPQTPPTRRSVVAALLPAVDPMLAGRALELWNQLMMQPAPATDA
eukprot:TRINITY_DN5814_c0_g4_i1.p1 TRINITY_DN5814_c0_g4~~TRINITY_DN5814_c0_g4_i1.p1  ORF type:complete len:824 (+),score=146.71 TRINITY_DN5814_c0_g4_i1:40-2511(+)